MMLQDPSNHIHSPPPLYSPRSNKCTTLGDCTFVAVDPCTSLLAQHQSSSAQSVASLEESTSTYDSGFSSVIAPRPLLPSPNSAFSPHFSKSNPHSPLTEPLAQPSNQEGFRHSRDQSLSSDLGNTEQIEMNGCYERKTVPDYDVNSYSPIPNKGMDSNSVAAENDSDTDSYAGRRGRQRRRNYRSRTSTMESGDSSSVRSSHRSSSDRFITNTEKERRANRKVLFENFVAQAEERDRKAKREQKAMDSFTKSRTRSSSLTRPTNSYSTYGSFDYGITGIKRSNSTNSRPQPSNTIRRSNSSVDIKDIINKAEKRDRHARIEQARLEGLIPARRYLGRKPSVRLHSTKPASSIIQDFECKTETDSPPLTGRSDKSAGCYRQDNNPTADAAPPSTESRHRKFSSFIMNSRWSGGNYYSIRNRANKGSDGESYKSYRGHSTRNSTWNGSELPPNKRSSVTNDSKTNDENYDRNPQSMSSNAPRSAMSMGNLQQTAPDPDVSSPRSWRNNKQESSYRTEPSNIANTRRKATSHTTLTSIPASEPYKRQDIVDKRSAPYQADQAVSTPSYTKSPQEDLPSPPSQHFLYESKPTEKYPQNALDNPNYDHLPPPPPELTYDQNDGVNRRHFRPVKSDTPPLKSESGNIPSKESRIEQSPNFTKEKESAFPNKSTSQTLGRPGSGKRPEVARVTPTQKKKHNSDTASKSSTLPRHFKSASPWERDEREKKEQSIQEQLNALRDEEIDELSERSDLTPLEEDRLKNLLQERDFQARVQEEKMRMFSDEDGSEEDYSVPDRPDRDRLIRLEGAHAQRDAAVRDVQSSNNNDKENQDRLRWEEEQRRKKEEAEMRAKQEAERREERRRERERAERERQEERRKREEQRREAQRREEEQERFEREKEREELSRMNEYTSLQREEQEQRRRLEEIRRMREEEEEQLRQLQAKREAEERSLQYNTESRRLKERLSKQKEAEAREDAEREYLEQKLSAGKPGNYGSSHRRHQSSSSYGPTSYSADSGNQQKKPSFYKTSYTPSSSTNRAPTGSVSTSSSRPVMRGNSKSTSARPVSDGYMLGKNDWSSEDTLPPQPSPSTPPSNSSGKRPISYVATARTPGVIGSQEVYNDPRNKREATMKRDQSFKRRGPDPSRLTFKDRQRLFQGGDGSPMERPKSSKKLLQLEENLRDQM